MEIIVESSRGQEVQDVSPCTTGKARGGSTSYPVMGYFFKPFGGVVHNTKIWRGHSNCRNGREWGEHTDKERQRECTGIKKQQLGRSSQIKTKNVGISESTSKMAQWVKAEFSP
jgi:hypothetical protein